MRKAIPLTALLFFCFALCSGVAAQTFTVLHSFTGQADGENPAASPIMDRAGNLYGTTAGGNFSGVASAFELKSMNSGWLSKPLFDFPFDPGVDGFDLVTKPAFGPDGALYLAARKGGIVNNRCGEYGCGTVVKLQPRPTACGAVLCGWNATVIYSFTGLADGQFPDQIVFGPDGNLYGTTLWEGLGGSVYRLTSSGGTWTRTTIFPFSGTNGSFPLGGVVFDRAGNAYGVTESGGSNNWGVVYELTPVANGYWIQTILHTFSGMGDGGAPAGPLTMDAAGNLFGVTGLTYYPSAGTVFELSQPGTWNFQTIYSIPSEGAVPNSGLLLDSAGDIYSTASGGGINGAPVVFKLTLNNGMWSYTDLYDFSPSDGKPNGGLIFDADGNLYGTTNDGGAFGYGTVWKLTP